MTLKICGVFLIIASSIYSGVLTESKCKKRLKEIENIYNFMCKLKENILNTFDSLDESIIKTAKEFNFITKECFVSLSEDMKMSCKNMMYEKIKKIPNQPLFDSDIAILDEFVQMIDTRNIDSVIRVIDQCNEKFKNLFESEGKDALSKCRLYKNIMIWTGVLTVILLF